jgi:formylglycine-generating enzyme required for sulfatase activity/thiol-disulfide isomerase/thioredoxin
VQASGSRLGEAAVDELLARPGVRLVAVTFAASWCKPCEESAPRWRALAEKHRARGLRVVVVSTRDPEAACAAPGFPADELLCDLDGDLADDFRVGGRLPASFLWSWSGELLVRRGAVGDVESAVEGFFARAPRVAVEGAPSSSPALVAAVREALVDAGKVEVLADPEARAAIDEARRTHAGARFDERAACALGQELPASAVLRVSEIAAGRATFANVALYDLVTGCQAASATAKREPDVAGVAREIIGKMLGKLSRPGGLQRPFGPSVSLAAVSESARYVQGARTAPSLSSAPLEADVATRAVPRVSPRVPEAAARAAEGYEAPLASVAPMIAYRGGLARFGSEEGEGDPDERPRFEATLEPFALDATEVTVEAYAACVRAKRCSLPGVGHGCNWGRPAAARHPINCVDWSQASAFCAAVGKRLPTEREWEFAARGTDRRRFPWGSAEPGARGCWNGDGRRGWGDPRRSTCEVGRYDDGATPEGAYDLAGNVWEWTASAYCDYPRAQCTESRRVFRGGGWRDEAGVMLRAALRSGDEEDERNDHLGFRCAR